MTIPMVTERKVNLEPVSHDPFIEALDEGQAEQRRQLPKQRQA